MIRRRTLGRLLFFGLGYVAGTRAGRERYSQIEEGAKAVLATLRGGGDDGTSSSSRPSSGGRTDGRGSDPYGDITLGRS
jgi:hypothetical protein